MSFPKSLPKRSPDKHIVIDLGDKMRVRLDGSSPSQSRWKPTLLDISRTKINIKSVETDRIKPRLLTNRSTQNEDSPRNIHMLNKSSKPIIESHKSCERRTVTVSNFQMSTEEASGTVTKMSTSRPKKLEIDRKSIDIHISPATKSSMTLLSDMVKDLLQSKKNSQLRVMKRLTNRPDKRQKPEYQDLSKMDRIWDLYEGQTLNNMMDGNGSVTFLNGQKYVGSFEKGLPHGHGTYYRQYEAPIIGYWQNGKLKNRLA